MKIDDALSWSFILDQQKVYYYASVLLFFDLISLINNTNSFSMFSIVGANECN